MVALYGNSRHLFQQSKYKEFGQHTYLPLYHVQVILYCNNNSSTNSDNSVCGTCDQSCWLAYACKCLLLLLLQQLKHLPVIRELQTTVILVTMQHINSSVVKNMLWSCSCPLTCLLLCSAWKSSSCSTSSTTGCQPCSCS